MQARIDGTELVSARQARISFRQSIFSAWAHPCAYCGQHAQSLDHVHPKATVRHNLVPACLRCNGAKSHREVFSWWRLQSFWCPIAQSALVDWLRSGE